MEPWNLEPARDTGLSPSERFRSVRRESGLLESLAHHTWFSLVRSYFAIAHRLTIIGREKLPEHGPFVLAANHCSHLDALALGAALIPRHRERAFPIAAGDVFFQTKVTSTFSAILLNALPMWRKSCGPHALADLRCKLEEEKAIYIIFPEGGRSRNGAMMPFKHGLGMLVAETNVPVVPCGLVGTFEALPPHRNIPRPASIKLMIGDPLQFASTSNNRSGWSEIAASVEARVRDLVANEKTSQGKRSQRLF
jgi:1-acyl-sn-glycerol-3-phosphate acyltransferase